jgi:multicomponent Na+:H+ antiporter subunit F
VTTIIGICLGGLTLAGALLLLRVLRGPTLADRVIALDALLVTVVSGIGVLVALTRQATFLDVLVVVSLLAFVSTVSVARFIERRER